MFYSCQQSNRCNLTGVAAAFFSPSSDHISGKVANWVLLSGCGGCERTQMLAAEAEGRTCSRN